jgi:Na+-transporting NADH:ubiquinone oxidoreductase subunit C
MNNNMKLILFVIILGAITSFLLLGMDLLTADRIEQNKEAQIKSVVLSINDISFNYTNIHTVFDETIMTYTYDDITFYQDEVTRNISFIFVGEGVWGDIRGIITLEDDFETIVGISILSQVETPGLGGVVAEEKYLSNYENVTFIDNAIEIIKPDNTPNDPNQVDAISGATRTSEKFQIILNTNYILYKNIWDDRPLEDRL